MKGQWGKYDTCFRCDKKVKVDAEIKEFFFQTGMVFCNECQGIVNYVEEINQEGRKEDER